MIRNVDTRCLKCGETHENVLLAEDAQLHPCIQCGGEIEQIWWKRPRGPAQWDDATAVEVHINLQTGDVRYPGQVGRPVKAGYERIHLRSLREVENFERAQGVRSEMAWFDKGSGRGFDDQVGNQRLTH